jgi:actin-related protein 3
VTVWPDVQGPEIFFNPEIFSSDFTVSLPDVVDESILKVPLIQL